MHGSKPKYTALTRFSDATKLFAALLDEPMVHLHTEPSGTPRVPVKWDISGNGHLQTCDPRCLHFHCPKCGDKVARESMSIYCEADRHLEA